MTTRERLHELVDLLDDSEVEGAMALLDQFVSTSSGAAGHPGMPAGGVEVVDREELLRLVRPMEADDPLWDLVGIVGDEYEGPTDVSANKHAYLADAYSDLHKG